MVRKRLELLSPVGSFGSLQAVISAGADAIYFGVEQLNMRTWSSKAFSIKDIKEISFRCKIKAIKSYITLNTLIKSFPNRSIFILNINSKIKNYISQIAGACPVKIIKLV